MKAIQVHKFGGPEVLQFETDVPIPLIAPDEVLINVKAAAVNPVDMYIGLGTHAFKPTLPYIPGNDCAGIVQKLGSSVPKGLFQIGQRVHAAFKTTSGSYAEYATVPARYLQLLPDEISFEQGLVLGASYLTAYRAVMNKIKIRPGEKILIHGASGGMGVASVQIARAYGATVIGTAGTKEGEKVVKDAGAHYVFNHCDSNYTDDIMKLADGVGPDGIVENNAHLNLSKALKMIAQNGRIAVVGSKGSIEINPHDAMAKEANVIGIMIFLATDLESSEAMAALNTGIANKWLRPIVGKVFPLSKASEAHEEMNNGNGAVGKIVLTVD